MTIFINAVISIMIVFRLLTHEGDMQTVSGIQIGSSPFRKAILICMESCALVGVCAGLDFAIAESSVKSLSKAAPIFSMLLTHISVTDFCVLIVNL